MVSCDRRNGKMILSSVTNVRACEPEPEPRAYFASHCACFLFLFFKFLFNVLFFYSVLKCYTWLQKQKFSIFFRALNSAQVVFLSVSNLISSNGCWRSIYGFRYKWNLSFPSRFSYQNIDINREMFKWGEVYVIIKMINISWTLNKHRSERFVIYFFCLPGLPVVLEKPGS